MRSAGLFVFPQLGDSVLSDPALVPLSGLKQGLLDPRDLAYLTRVNIECRASVIKTRANPRAGIAEQDPLELVYDRELLASIVAAARGAGVLCHAYSAEGIAGAVAAGVRSIEHGVFVSERTLAQMARRGTYFTPTLTGVAAMSGSSNPVLAERGREYTPVLRAAIRTAADAGVRVVSGTDSFGADVIRIGTEALNLQEPGLTALQSVTTNAASLLGMEGEVGRLVRRALPDVVLLEANPLESAAVWERVSTIIAQGRVVGEE